MNMKFKTSIGGLMIIYCENYGYIDDESCEGCKQGEICKKEKIV